MNINKVLQQAVLALPLARHEAEWLVAHYLGLTKNQLFLQADSAVSPENQEKIKEALRRRKLGEPLQYILGCQPFMDFVLQVTPAVLIPRWDSEVVVEAALKQLPKQGALKVADIGTGSGALAISLKYYRPEALVWAVDISPQALEVAKANALSLGLEITFCLGDLLAPLAGEADFDLLISNPPYIPSAEVLALAAEVLQEPKLALDGGGDGLAYYRRLQVDAIPKLKTGGCLIVEIGCDQGEAVSNLWRQAGLKNVEVGFDYGHNQRYVLGFKA